jgi:broad specificity phosphatase PhoE
MTLFEDHLVRDINAGRFGPGTSLVLVTHGLALRIFLMRWFHWSVSDFLQCYNPPNAAPVVLERTISPIAPDGVFDSVDGVFADDAAAVRVHTKALYRLAPASMAVLKGCTERMCYVG